MEQNRGILRGTLSKEGLVKDYEREEEIFYKGTLLVNRLSETVDEIPIIVPDKHLLYFNCNGEITLEGSFRSRNKFTNGKSTLQLYFFVEGVIDTVLDSTNTLTLEGYICRKPQYRLTPFNREICDLLIAVNRNNKKSDYIPCLVWGRNAKWARNLEVGEKVILEGRIQSRRFTKPGDTELFSRVAYEVSASKIFSPDGNKLTQN